MESPVFPAGRDVGEPGFVSEGGDVFVAAAGEGGSDARFGFGEGGEDEQAAGIEGGLPIWRDAFG